MNFKTLKQAIKTTRTLCESENLSYKANKESIIKEYSKESAKPRLEALEDYHSKKIKDYKSGVVSDVWEWYETQRNNFCDCLMKCPPKTLLDTLNIYSKRSNVSKAELEVLLTRCRDNYQGLKFCEEIAKNSGYDVSLSVNFESLLNDLDDCKIKLLNIAESCDKNEKDFTIEEFAFYGSYDDEKSPISTLCLELENVEAFVPEVTRFEKAKAEIEDNILNGDIEKATKKAILLSRDLEDILTDEESEMVKGDN